MTNPQPKPFEPSREQVDKIAFEVCIMTPNEMAKWHLTELHRETEKLRGENESNKENRKLLAEDLVALTKGLPCKLHLAQQVHSRIDDLQQQLATANERIGWLETQREVECGQKESALRESEMCLRERDDLRTQLKQAEAKFNRLADDALVALAGHVATPGETYKQAPHCLSGDIRRLVQRMEKLEFALKQTWQHLDIKQCPSCAACVNELFPTLTPTEAKG